MGYMGVEASSATFMSHGPGSRQMAHTLNWVIEESLIKRLRTVRAECKERNKDVAASKMSISTKSLPEEARGPRKESSFLDPKRAIWRG